MTSVALLLDRTELENFTEFFIWLGLFDLHFLLDTS